MTKSFVFVLVSVAVLGYLALFHVHDYAPFALLGMLGAIFANATGAGGGVVFIPAFSQLGINEAQSVATSFAIQCFGMTTGSILWLRHSRQQSAQIWLPLKLILLLCIPASVFGLWIVYANQLNAPASLSQLFGYFSVLIGLGLLALYVTTKKDPVDQAAMPIHLKLLHIDGIALLIISAFGGAITAWLSVGVGELVAFYLIVRGYRVPLAIASAVMISAATVWSGVGYHVQAEAIYWQVFWFAAPGAVVGAMIAKLIATRLPVQQLKLFFAFWVLIVGMFELISK